MSTSGMECIRRMTPVAMNLLLAATTATATTHPGTWLLGEDLPSIRYETTTAVVDGVAYVIGGSPGATLLDTVEAYEPVGRTWTARAPMPTPRAFAASAVVDGRIYVFGGVREGGDFASTAVEAYDPATDSWESRSPLPAGRWGPAAAAVDGLIYVIGGGTGDLVGLHTYYTNTWIYDPAGDSWSIGAPMLTPRAGLGAVAFDGLVYAVGGKVRATTSGGDISLTVTGALEIYDPATDSWRQSVAMSVPRESHATAALDGRVYAIGGLAYDDAGMRVVAELEVYDTGSQAWQRLGRMPFPRWGAPAAVVNGTIHLFGGSVDMFPGAGGHHAVDSYQPERCTYWTELVAHGAGSFGSQWRSDLCAASRNAEPAQVALELYTAHGVIRHDTELAPREQRHFDDVVAMMGAEGKGMLAVSADRVLRVAGRTYSEEAAGSFGQACEFRTMEEGLWRQESAWLVGLRQQTGEFRTNVSLANAGIRQGAVKLTLYASDGSELNHTSWILLEPGEAHQELEPFANLAGAPDVGWGYIRVDVGSGAGILASASVIDSRTNDAAIILAHQ